jgi:hypothetical protein
VPQNYRIAKVRADNVAVGKHAKILIDDQYSVEQAMAVGPKAKAHADSVQFIKFSGDGAIDNQRLAEELAALRTAVRDDPHASQDEKDEAVGALLEAERSAEAGNAEGTRQALSRVGKWVLRTAEAIGIGLAVQALIVALGL